MVFDTTGAFVETKRRPTLIGLRPWPGALGSEGEVFDIAPDYAGASFQPLLVRYSNDFSTTDTIALPKYSGINFELTGSDGRRRMVAAVPFTPYSVWRLDPTGHIWSGVTGSYRIAKQTLTGDTLLVFDKRYIPVSVTNADLEAAIERLQGFVNTGGRIDESLIPSVKPAFVAIYIDDRSHVWVRLSAASESEPYISFDVFDPNGRYLGLIRTELRGGSPLIIRGDRMYAVGLDELDVPYVIRLAIRGRASDEAVAP